jgi:ribonuclease HI
METISIYTDGSCNPNPGKGGWAYIALLNDLEIHSNGGMEDTTNNIMELTAVINCLIDFSEYRNFTIFSDSLYVINCAQGKWKRKKNIELWKTYDSVSKNKNISFRWVKSHNGDKYNDIVDSLAKKGAFEKK